MTTITITHTMPDGTLATGTTKGDTAGPLLTAASFRHSGRLHAWYLRNTRDRPADRPHLDRLATALRAAGYEVVVTIDDTPRTFAEAEAERTASAAVRAATYAARGQAARDRATAAQDRADAIRRQYPMGQPVLVDHHSARRHLNDLDRAHRAEGRAVEARADARHWEHRAEWAGDYAAHRNDPGTTLRRIERLEAELRRVEAILAAYDGRTPTDAATAHLPGRPAVIRDEIGYWRAIIAAFEAGGGKVWSRADFIPGDYARHGSRWYEVLRVNAKTVTVPAPIRPGDVVRRADATRTGTLPYTDLHGHMTAADMANHGVKHAA